jgi:lipopolysaccharide export system permease protein
MIIFRYLTREIFAALSAITAILLLIFLSNQFVRYLNQAAAGKFAGTLLLQLMAIEIPHLLAVLLPLGLFLGILLAYGRLYADNEMTVLSACGFSRLQLIGYTLPTAFFIAIIVGILSLWLNPKLLADRDQMLMRSGTALELQTTLPGRFQQANNGNQVFYAQSLSADHLHMQNLFFAELNKNSTNPAIPIWTIVTAQSGYQLVDHKTGDQFFVATEGRHYKGIPGDKDFQVMRFGSYTLRLANQTADLSDQQETFPTKALLASTSDITKKEELIAELEWRISMPLSAVFLTLLAIPLSRVEPRRGRYAQLLPAILIYATYTNLLLVARNWIMHGTIPLVLGLWWIHVLLLVGITCIWSYQIGWRTLRKQSWLQWRTA